MTVACFDVLMTIRISDPEDGSKDFMRIAAKERVISVTSHRRRPVEADRTKTDFRILRILEVCATNRRPWK
jgi:hypothetical protein